MEKYDLKWAEQYSPGGVHSNTRRIEPQIMPRSAVGSRLTSTEGKEYVDYHAAFGPIILGHAYEPITRKVVEALQDQDLFGIGATEMEMRTCAKIVEHMPSAEKVLLTNSGSESTFHAIRVSRAYTGRKKLIKFQGCYHGWHDSVSRNVISSNDMIGKRDPSSAGILDEVIDATLVCRFNDLDDVQRTIEANKGEVAAIIIEPIPHNIGCVLPDQAFLEGLREITRVNGIILIFDEVITGFRHALGGFQSLCGITPDLTTLGKAMANGYPIAAIAGKAEIMDSFTTNPQGNALFAGTYNGHAIGTAAVLATIEIFETEPVHEHNARLGKLLADGIQGIADRNGVSVNVQSYGSVFVPYFMEGPIRNYEDLMRSDNERDLKFRRGMIELGFLMFPMAMKRNHVMYVHTDEDVAATLEAAEAVMKQIR